MIERQLRTLTLISILYLAVMVTCALTGDGFGALAVYAAFSAILLVNGFFHWARQHL